MILTRTVTTEHGVTLPEPAYATLLSVDEFQLCNDYETSAIKKRVDGWFQRLLKSWRQPKEDDDD